MNTRKWKVAVWLALLSAASLASCVHRTYVIVPRPNGGYRPDTLRATLDGNTARVIFRFDTVTHTRTIVVHDTLWRDGVHIIHDTVRLVRRDTVRVVQRDTVRPPTIMNLRRDTVRIVRRDTVRIFRTDTVDKVRVDTVRLASNVDPARVDTVRVPFEVRHVIRQGDTVRRTDTVHIVQPPIIQRRVDTVRVVRADTIRVVVTDTVRVTSSGGGGGSRGRTLFVPPGHYPPEGQCRVWIDGLPPGQQRRPGPCDQLGDIPAGAFILYGGVAWDFDYDWVSASAGSAPPQIVALKKARGKP